MALRPNRQLSSHPFPFPAAGVPLSPSSLPPQADDNDFGAPDEARAANVPAPGTAAGTDRPTGQGPVGAASHHAPGDTSDLPKLIPGGARYRGAKRQRSTTVPFDDTDQPQPFYRKPIAWVLGVLGLCVAIAAAIAVPVAITGADHSNDDAAAAAFTAELAGFDSVWTVDAVEASAVSGIGVTWETKYSATAQPERAQSSLTQHCAALDTSKAAYNKLTSVSIPTLAESASATPSPAYQDAAALAESRGELFAAATHYSAAGAAQFDALESICSSLGAFTNASQRQASATEKLISPLLIAPEESERVITTTGSATLWCSSDEPCEPISSPRREEYARALATISATFDADVSAVYRDSCPGAELSDYCAQAVEAWTRIAEINQETEERFVKEVPVRGSVPLPEYTAWLTGASAEKATLQAALDSWLTSTFPDLVVADDDNPFVSHVMTTADTLEHNLAALRTATIAAIREV